MQINENARGVQRYTKMALFFDDLKRIGIGYAILIGVSTAPHEITPMRKPLFLVRGYRTVTKKLNKNQTTSSHINHTHTTTLVH